MPSGVAPEARRYLERRLAEVRELIADGDEAMQSEEADVLGALAELDGRVARHRALDALVAEFLGSSRGSSLGDATILDLICWHHGQLDCEQRRELREPDSFQVSIGRRGTEACPRVPVDGDVLWSLVAGGEEVVSLRAGPGLRMFCPPAEDWTP